PDKIWLLHLSQEDTLVTLQDEDGKEFNIKYIGHRTELSTGWRQFCVAHNLVAGDVLVFQLVGKCRFMVYRIRATDLAEVDNHAEFMEQEANVNAVMEVVSSKSSQKKRRKPQSSLLGKKILNTSKPRSSFGIIGQPAEQTKNDSEEVGSEVLEDFKLSFHAFQFKNIKSCEDFNIVIKGCVLDSELTKEVQRKYYKLCHGQNYFLHDNIIKGLDYLKLIVAINSETVNTIDAMKECTLSSSQDEFTNLDKASKAYDIFSLNVLFLLARLKHLVKLPFNFEDTTRTIRNMEVRVERLHTEVEIRNLEAKLAETKVDVEGMNLMMLLEEDEEDQTMKF
ncbi:B3 domain-containing protein Os01g0234100, partial [Linum grandiflorum]